ncbi:MAG: UDP-N-acetylmuramoyl-tripeptide--D-alanyl-D-alanine ligase, partial [Synechococcales cyanobacterium RM1_1_8]|nr:UDP-N-acetylmuramoyl-tripeptide--D-alanyl-D-alanine ligase [Synechococcales cyanobacterium RM1_1_8]
EAAALAAGAAGVPVQAFDRPEPLVDYLQKVGQPGDCILFKASRGVALDRVVAQLQRHWSA